MEAGTLKPLPLSSSLKQWQQSRQHQLQQIPVQQHQSVLNNQLLNHQMLSQTKTFRQSGRLGWTRQESHCQELQW